MAFFTVKEVALLTRTVTSIFVKITTYLHPLPPILRTKKEGPAKNPPSYASSYFAKRLKNLMPKLMQM